MDKSVKDAQEGRQAERQTDGDHKYIPLYF